MKSSLRVIKVFITDTIIFTAGGIGLSLAINCFLSDNDILYGGFTGIATILNHISGFPIGAAILIMNTPLFLLSCKKLGGNFLRRTVWATLITSAIIDAGAFLPLYRGDLLLSSIMGGVLVGASLGIIFIRNASTGGVDVIAKLFRLKYPEVSFGKCFLIFDAIVVIAGGIVYRNPDAVLYAVVVTIVSAQMLDYVIFKSHKTTVEI